MTKTLVAELVPDELWAMVERSLSWLSCWRRLQVRWDRGSGRFFAFVLLACALTCFNRR